MNDNTSGIVAEFIFPEGQNEKYRNAVLPCPPRVGDKIRSATPQSGVYRVTEVTFLIYDHTAPSGQRPGATVEVRLETLDEVGGL